MNKILSIKEAIEYIEILELDVNNKEILNLKSAAENKLKTTLYKIQNPDWIIKLILEARKGVKND